MIRALVFDFDGLILDTETPIIEAWMELHEEARVPYEKSYAANIVGHVDIDFDPWIAFDAAVDREALEREHKKRTRAIIERQPVLPGVQACLEEARRLGLRTAIASNSSHAWVDNHVKRLGLARHFDLIKCREDVARGKPEPDLYRAALDAFSFQPREAVAFEDSQPGSVAAKSAGLWCVAIPNPSTQHHDFSHVDAILGTLADEPLPQLLRRWI